VERTASRDVGSRLQAMVATNSLDIAVVGGGITGAFTAYFLARLGLRPTLIERDRIGSAASGKNPGGLNPLHGAHIPGLMQPLALESFRLHLDNWGAIRQLSGIEGFARPVTKVHIAMDETDLPPLQRLKEAHDSTPGFTARWMDAEQMRAIEPRLNPSMLSALWTEGNCGTEAYSYTRAVAESAVDLGARIVTAAVRGLRRSGRRATHVLLDAGPMPCDGVVIATGPWTAEPSRWLQAPVPIEPVKGQLLQVRGASVKCDFAWRSAAVYGRGQDGELLLGGTEEHTGFDRVPTAAGRASILERLSRVFPRIKEASVLREIVGLRAATPDGLPLLGLAGGWENVCLALGAGRKGMLLSAGMGKAAAELLATGRTGLSVEACSPDRWAAGPSA
jgi:glycine/D-amino acid oxidase-like deaminating enzyme